MNVNDFWFNSGRLIQGLSPEQTVNTLTQGGAISHAFPPVMIIANLLLNMTVAPREEPTVWRRAVEMLDWKLVEKRMPARTRLRAFHLTTTTAFGNTLLEPCFTGLT